MTSEKALEDLEVLTRKLHSGMLAPEEPDIVWVSPSGGVGAVAYRLYRVDEVSVVRATLPADVPFPRHTHKEDEVLTCYQGRLLWKIHSAPPDDNFRLTLDTADGVLLPGESLYMPANTPHSVMANGEECRCIGVTVPASEGL